MFDVERIIPLLPTVAGLSDVDAALAINALPLTPRTSPIYVTYLSLGERADLFGPAARNLAGQFRSGLESWIGGIDLSRLNPLLPNPGTLKTLHSRLDGFPGLDFSKPEAPGFIGLFAAGVAGVHDPIITVDQAAALLRIGFDVPDPATADDVAAARAEKVRRDAATVRLTVATDLITRSKAWERTNNEQIAHRAAEFVTAVEAWRDSDQLLFTPPSITDLAGG